MEKALPYLSSTPPNSTGSKASMTPPSSSRLSPQTSQFNRLMDLVTEHEAHYRDNDVKIAELSRKLAALGDKQVSGGDGSDYASVSCKSGGLAELKEDIASLKAAIQHMNKSVVLLAQENEVTRKRQASFVEEVGRQIAESQRDVDHCLREVKDIRETSKSTYKHLKHQCKSYILENLNATVDQTRGDLEALVKGEIARLDGKFQASNDIQNEKQVHQADLLQQKLDLMNSESTDIKMRVEQILKAQETQSDASKEIDRKLERLSGEVEEAKASIGRLSDESESTSRHLSATRNDLINTQKHLIDRTKDLKHLLKKVSYLVHARTRSDDADAENVSSTALNSAKLYNSWRSTIFAYSPKANKENESILEFDNFARKLKQRLRESEREMKGLDHRPSAV
ncbi:hypothetical protein HOP50_11g64480 [Chloropicon primus]|uniref:Uncharacterized protein n=1 Tax=Chloropicon primus TaxID=1764295 RepID=A0A5B8MWS3_9CHLO|nr:hypothetical protein A3770_11p64280 [Chloropicon primus]UPR03121.1 hypothetical protein HOP50_11g64480 [Chloropicon primus]|eukprot:QDZ23910.1 hypothetical protein A3770_11p64280 [Chloropicon primus]